MKTAFLSAALLLLGVSSMTLAADGKPEALVVKSIAGEDVDLAKYKGQVLLVVNVASKCGLTDQYKGLETLHEQYGDKGLTVLGFPCNQFGKQEPGTNAEILEFCKDTYNVKFPMFAKVDVNGDDASPLYKYLTSAETKPIGPGKISWNFEKFVIGRDGKIAGRFAPRTAPNDPELMKVIEAELAKK